MIWAAALKAIPGFLHTWRIYIVTGMLLAAGITVFNYIDNHGEMKAALAAGKLVIDDQALEIKALRREVQARDARLAAERARKLAELEATQVRLEEANALVDELRDEQARVRQELEVTRFETLEAIRDDEEMADWVDNVVPVAAWSLLRQAAEGTTDN